MEDWENWRTTPNKEAAMSTNKPPAAPPASDAPLFQFDADYWLEIMLEAFGEAWDESGQPMPLTTKQIEDARVLVNATIRHQIGRAASDAPAPESTCELCEIIHLLNQWEKTANEHLKMSGSNMQVFLISCVQDLRRALYTEHLAPTQSTKGGAPMFDSLPINSKEDSGDAPERSDSERGAMDVQCPQCKTYFPRSCKYCENCGTPNANSPAPSGEAKTSVPDFGTAEEVIAGLDRINKHNSEVAAATPARELARQPIDIAHGIIRAWLQDETGTGVEQRDRLVKDIATNLFTQFAAGEQQGIERAAQECSKVKNDLHTDWVYLREQMAEAAAKARLDFIEKVCADICGYCAPGSPFPELHDGKYHTEKGIDPGYFNYKCHAADLRERMQRIAQLEKEASAED